MTNSMKSVCMAAAVAGLLGGTTIRMQAQIPTPSSLHP